MNEERQQELFKRLGMSKHAAAVYAAAAETGPHLALELIRKAQTHAPAGYRAITELVEAGLLHKEARGKRTAYRAAPTKRIIELFKAELLETEKNIQAHAKGKPEKTEASDPSFKILRGKDGIRQVFDDVIDHSSRGDVFYRYTSEKDTEAVNAILSPDYRARRDKKRLERHVISNPQSGKTKRPRLERFIRHIPSEAGLFTQNIIQLIYGTRVAFIDLTREKAFIIDNPELASFQKVIFRQLYKKLQ